MATAREGGDFIKELATALGLPKNCIEFTLTARVDDVVKINCWYIPEPQMMPVLKKYRLTAEEIKED